MNRDLVITIDQVVEKMKTQLQKSPIMPGEFAAFDSFWSIFRVPVILSENNKRAYKPRIVSIGPYHHGKEELAMMQEHKWRYLRDFLARTSKSVDFFVDFVVFMENAIRLSYLESIEHIASTDLVEMMVLDGVFLIELFRKVGKVIPTDADDPIFKAIWLIPLLKIDLLKIENQIPFFVLQNLFDVSSGPSDYRATFSSLVLWFFDHAVGRQREMLQIYRDLLEGEGVHILDIFRKNFISANVRNYSRNEIRVGHPKLIRPASKLVIYGVSLKPNSEPESILDIKFQNGVLLIPQFNFDDFYTSLLSNCVAFEQGHNSCPKEVTAYIVFLGCLLTTPADVVVLSESNIINNFLGTDTDLVKFFSDLAAVVAFDIRNNYLLSEFTGVNDYCSKSWHKYRTGFKDTYFKSPWVFNSALAAILLLLLTVLQTFYTIYGFYHK